MKKSQPHFGRWLSIGSPVIAELAALSGFDWLMFDLAILRNSYRKIAKDFRT